MTDLEAVVSHQINLYLEPRDSGVLWAADLLRRYKIIDYMAVGSSLRLRRRYVTRSDRGNPLQREGA